MGNARKLSATALIGLAGALLTPTLALAESEGGPVSLIPDPAEFFPALIAFLVIWFVLAKLAWPSILGMMNKRQNKIQADLDDAEKSREEAANEVKKRKAEALEISRKADGIIAEATKEAEEARARILAQAQREAAETIAKAEDAVANERHKAMIELSTQVVDLAVEISSKIIGNALSEEQQRELAAKYLQEVGTSDEQ